MTDSAWDCKLVRVAKALSETFDSTGEAASKAAAIAQRWGINGRDTLEDVVVAGKDDLVKAAKAAASSAKEPTQTLEQLRDAISAGAAAAKEAALKAKNAASVAYANRNQIASDAVDAVTGAAQRAAADPRAVASALASEGWQHGREVVLGAYHGAVDVFQDVGVHFEVGRADISPLEARLLAQIEEFRQLSAAAPNASASRPGNRNYLDDVLVGGDVLLQALKREIPRDVLSAYALQYPRLASEDSFREHLLGFASDEQRKDFVTALKGKLFEIRYVDFVNDGQLPPGYHADLAPLANQSGYDIVVSGPDGSIQDLIQAKATDSAAYVKRALERYPDIDVATTTEVHQDLVIRGLGERVADGNVTNADLAGDMESASSAAQQHMDGPSLLSLALIAFTSYGQDGLDAYKRSRRFGERSGAYVVAYGSGALTDVGMDALVGDLITGIPFLATAVTLATRSAASAGRQKLNKLEALRQVVADNDAALQRMRFIPPVTTFA